MPIPLECACGRSLRVKDELAGRKVKCPQCGGVLLVPQPEDEMGEVLPADDPEEMVQTAPRAAGRRARDEDDDRSRREEVRRRQEREEEREREAEREERRLLKQHRRESRRDAVRYGNPGSPSRGWLGGINAGIGGGIAMIIVAVIWFVAGLAFGILFWYPPILAVIGVIAIIKGAVDR